MTVNINSTLKSGNNGNGNGSSVKEEQQPKIEYEPDVGEGLGTSQNQDKIMLTLLSDINYMKKKLAYLEMNGGSSVTLNDLNDIGRLFEKKDVNDLKLRITNVIVKKDELLRLYPYSSMIDRCVGLMVDTVSLLNAIEVRDNNVKIVFGRIQQQMMKYEQ